MNAYQNNLENEVYELRASLRWMYLSFTLSLVAVAVSLASLFLTSPEPAIDPAPYREPTPVAEPRENSSLPAFSNHPVTQEDDSGQSGLSAASSPPPDIPAVSGGIDLPPDPDLPPPEPETEKVGMPPLPEDDLPPSPPESDSPNREKDTGMTGERTEEAFTLPTSSPETKLIYYKVKKNDTLSKIALKHFGTWKAYKKIKKDNNLSSDLVKPGQVLLIIKEKN